MGFFESTGEVNYWNPLNTAFHNVMSLCLLNKTLYAGTWDEGIFKTIDGGDNWVPASGGLPIKDMSLMLLHYMLEPGVMEFLKPPMEGIIGCR